MTTLGTFRLRPPTWTQVWVVLFPMLVAVVSLSGVVPLRGNADWWYRLLFCLFAAALGWRLFRLAAIGTADGRLVVRNHWGDRTLLRTDVADVAVAYVRRGSFGKAVRLVLRDGSTLTLDVTEVPFAMRRLERDAAAVREWLSGGQP